MKVFTSLTIFVALVSIFIPYFVERKAGGASQTDVIPLLAILKSSSVEICLQINIALMVPIIFDFVLHSITHLSYYRSIVNRTLLSIWLMLSSNLLVDLTILLYAIPREDVNLLPVLCCCKFVLVFTNGIRLISSQFSPILRYSYMFTIIFLVCLYGIFSSTAAYSNGTNQFAFMVILHVILAIALIMLCIMFFKWINHLISSGQNGTFFSMERLYCTLQVIILIAAIACSLGNAIVNGKDSYIERESKYFIFDTYLHTIYILIVAIINGHRVAKSAILEEQVQ